MKLDKAIEILDDMINPENTIGNADDKNAIQLGIEALKVVIKAREGNYTSFKLPLPGETKFQN